MFSDNSNDVNGFDLLECVHGHTFPLMADKV
jgi:hypothetical protein